RMVGPFVFFDRMGPTVFDAGRGLDVRPHPHIGLATVTYLFDGEILHRDSLGSVQPIRPGEVNWMTAGRGIVHSERTSAALRAVDAPLSGIQVWVALPREQEEAAPMFSHHGESALPQYDEDGARVRLIAGSWQGARSPAPTFSPMFYADVALAPGARLPVDTQYAERAAFIVEGQLNVHDARFEAGQLVVFRPGAVLTLRAGDTPVRLMLFG